MKSGIYRAVKEFFRTTTLHGFKYLCLPYYSDRIAWLSICCASTCGAGMLCAVLWARFLNAPLLLTRGSLAAPAHIHQRAPLIAICPSPYRAAQLIADNFSLNLTEANWLPVLFSKILRGRQAEDDHRLLLDSVLDRHNTTLSQALMDHMAPCKEMMRRCQWQHSLVECKKLFAKELTRWGACCVMRAERSSITHYVLLGRKCNALRALKCSVAMPNSLLDLNSLDDYLQTTERLDLMMDCYIHQNHDAYCCELFIKYRGEDWLGPWYLMSGSSYAATLTFTAVQDLVKEKLVDGTCVSTPLFSNSRCMILCKETECGCSHPLRLVEYFETNLPPPCSVMRMKCLGNFIRGNDMSCNCPPACQRITAYMSLESMVINDAVSGLNPIYEDVNSKSSIIVNIRIRVRGSKSYELKPTESWLTLLSSLGGIFNMFLGIGLFSILECIFFLISSLSLSLNALRKELHLREDLRQTANKTPRISTRKDFI